MLGLVLAAGLAQTEAPLLPAPPPTPPAEERRVSPRKELAAERRQLLASMPGKGAPAAVIMLGGFTALVGLALLLVGYPALTNDCCVSRTVFFVGAPVTIVGALATGLGFVWLRSRIFDREPMEERLEQIDKELAQ